MNGFKDHFSGHAADYAKFRPTYPAELYAWLAERTPTRERAWDAGTGNGQVAVALAGHFGEVVATDASAEQIAAATPHPRVTYRVATAEDSGLPDAHVDLVTVAQALHWFDIDRFFAEARRCLRPGGLVAVWQYVLIHVTDPIDAVVRHLYTDLVGPYWPPERALVERGYADIPFPFERLDAPPFAIETSWDLPALVGYLGTWSATRRYQAAKGHDPVAIVASDLAAAWGDPTASRRVSWPLGLRVGHT